MHESRCGIRCGECGRKEQVGCMGCTHMERPFWGGECLVKSCCESKGLAHCGSCSVFPCAMLSMMGVKEGHDPEPRIKQCREWTGE